MTENERQIESRSHPAVGRATVSRATVSNDDGTRQLLRWGAITLAAGFAFALLTKTVFGGIGPQGPHTNAGWLGLIAAMMCLPFGSMVFLLGAAKWLRNRRLANQKERL